MAVYDHKSTATKLLVMRCPTCLFSFRQQTALAAPVPLWQFQDGFTLVTSSVMSCSACGIPGAATLDERTGGAKA